MEENLTELQAYFEKYHDLDLNEAQILDIIHNIRKYDKIKKNQLFGVIDIVSKVFNVSVNDIKSKSRKAPLPDARKCYYHLSNIFFPKMHYNFFADYINSDRTSVFAGIKASENLLKTDIYYNHFFIECHSFLKENEIRNDFFERCKIPDLTFDDMLNSKKL